MNIYELRFQAGEIVDEVFYCSDLNMNGLFKMHLQSGEISFAGYFKDNPVNSRNLHCGSILYKDWIVFMPKRAKGIDLYNWRTGEFKCVYYSDETGYWMNGVLCGNIIWFIPLDAINSVCSLNMDTFSICTYRRPLECMNGRKNMGKMYRAVYFKGKIYAAIFETRYVFCFSVDTKKMEILDTGIDCLCVADSSRDGLWLLLEHGKEIYYWKPESGKKYSFPCRVETPVRENGRLASFVLETKGDIYLFPGCMSTNIMKFNRSEKVFEETLIYPEDMAWRSLDSNCFWGSAFYKQKYYVYPFNAGYIIVVGDENIEFIKVGQIKNLDKEKICKDYFLSTVGMEVIKEQQLFLNVFLCVTKEIDIYKMNNIKNIGKQIYTAILMAET